MRGNEREMEQLFKSIIDADRAPIVVCNMQAVIVYMNPSAIKRYNGDHTGKSVRGFHSAGSNEKIDRVVEWFSRSRDNNVVYTSRNDRENKDVYMVALRDGDGELIGYYEKHEYRDAEIAPLYDI